MGSSKNNIEQAVDQAAILIRAKTDSSQTMVKLCKNGTEWLSPTGWSHAEKSTLLDSENEGGLTRFTIPKSFASDIKSGDKISLTISSLDFEGTMSWADARSSGAVAISGAMAEFAKSATKRGLFGRFGGRKAHMPQQSEIERLAEEARAVAEASSAEMRRAHEAMQAAEHRALEAARLAEAAHKTEQERILEADRATKALAKAEAAKRVEKKRIERQRLAEEARLAEEVRLAELARIAEEKRLEAERKAELARLTELARIAERARREQAARELDEERLVDIKRLSGEISDTKDAIRTYKGAAQDLSDRAKKAKSFVKSQGEVEAQARRTFELAERKVAEGEAELAKRLQGEHTTKDGLKRIEKTVSEHLKLSNKAASAAQKTQSALENAELAANTAAAKASELRITSRSAQDEAQSLQRSLRTYQQQAQDLGTQKDRAETAGTAARATLEQVRDSLGSAKGGLKDASNIHAEAGNAMRQTDGLIAENQAKLQNARDRATKMRAKVEHLKAQKITADNVSEMADILKMYPEVSATGLKKAAAQKNAAQKTAAQKAAAQKAAALASRLGGTALIMDTDGSSVGGSSDGMMSKLKGLFSRGHDEAETMVDETLTDAELSTDDVVDGAVEKKSEKTPKKIPLSQKEFVTENKPPDKTAVKLVSETDESDLEKPERGDDGDTDPETGPETGPETDPETDGTSRKAIMGLLAVLLLSVASIGVIASNAFGPQHGLKPVAKASTGNTRIAPQAVLPATVSAIEIIPVAAIVKVPAPLTGLDSKNAPAGTVAEATIDAVLQKPDGIEIAPVVLVAENTALPKRTWGDGTINLDSAPKAVATQKPVRVAARIVPKRRAPEQQRAVSVIIPATPIAIQAAPTLAPYSEVTKDMQTKLVALGFYSGATTGRLDATTISAMNDFQKLFGQAETKIITRTFLDALNNTKIVTTSRKGADAGT